MSIQLTRRQFITRLLGTAGVLGAASAVHLIGTSTEQKLPPKSFTIPDPKMGDSFTVFHTDKSVSLTSIVSTGTSLMKWRLGYSTRDSGDVDLSEFQTDHPSYKAIRLPGNARVYATIDYIDNPKRRGELAVTMQMEA